MEILSRIKAALLSPSQDDIITAMDPWVLACAVGAENGTIGSRMDFDTWLRLSCKNWTPKVKKKIVVSDAAIERALRDFVKQNCAKNYIDVLRELEQKRGCRPSAVLEPGESLSSVKVFEKD